MKYLLSLCAILILNPYAFADITYRLSMSDAASHYFDVEMQIPVNKQKSLQVSLPVWAPGSYLIREFSRNVESVRVSADGHPQIHAEAIDKNTWEISTRGLNSITVTYRVYAFELSVRTSFIDETHAYINGSSVFMFVNGRTNEACIIEIAPYPDWKNISTGLSKVSGHERTFSAKDYDELADCPIEIGNHKVINFSAAGVPHELAIYGESNCDIEKLSTDLQKLIDACVDIFGELPIDRYVFIIHNIDRRGGGLEHHNSTTMQFNRWSYEPEAAYISFLSLALHEYFHLWNVKRLRPFQLGPFDYENENHTDLLWVMEGVTSYYDEYLLLRTGFIDRANYLSRLASAITDAENRPGNNVQSLASASFYAWIKYYRPDENSRNTTVDYYGKGLVVAALLDLEIRSATRGEKSLDDLMKYMYDLYYIKKDRGFTHDEFIVAAEYISGKNLQDFFINNVFGTGAIDYQKYFNDFGISVIDLNENVEKVSHGLSLRQTDGRLIVERVDAGSAAIKSGLSAKDEIISVDGNRVNQSLFNDLITWKSVGDTVNLIYSRMGLLSEKQLILEKSTEKKFLLEEAAGEKLNLLRESWLQSGE